MCHSLTPQSASHIYRNIPLSGPCLITPFLYLRLSSLFRSFHLSLQLLIYPCLCLRMQTAADALRETAPAIILS